MFNRILDFLQHTGEAKYFIASLVLAITTSFIGFFSIYAWVAVVLTLIPVLSRAPLIQSKLSYDQSIYIKESLSLLSSLLWAFFMWTSLQLNIQLYSLVFVVLTVTALLSIRDLKIVLYIITPLLIINVVLLIFYENPAPTGLAVLEIIFTGLLLAIFYFKDDVVQVKSIDMSANGSGTRKMELVAEVDGMKIANKELTNQIKQIESELSAASMAKMEFLATMSHEIRTPLNGIIPLLDILLDSELSDFQKDYLSTAHVSAIQMQKLIDDLLDYSKVEAGKLSVEVRGIKILRLMDSIKSTYQNAAENKNITLEIKINNNVSPLLRGDPTRLRQILSNLVSNAIKFSSGGTVKISAKKLKDFPNKEVIRFSVADQGIGMDKETLENIFLPFTQEDGSSTRKFGGTGLGLAISKKIVELLHGTIGLKSEKGRGSTFFFDLPLLKSMGETQAGITSTSSFQAIIINTNPLLFNKISKDLKAIKVNFQKALGLSQAYEIYESINKNSDNTKSIIMLLDFETAGKQVRSICIDLEKDKRIKNLHIFILTENKNIAGIPNLKNIKLLSKHDDIEEHLNRIEVLQAAQESNESLIGKATSNDKLTKDPKELENIIPEILLVEDNEINLKVAEKLIQYIGYPFDFALNGQEALEKVKQNRYRMILMDCLMPVMDGYKCTAKIRDYEKAAGLNHTPILAMTANAMMGDREKCLDAGMDDYMSKPLNRYILEKTLKKWDPLNLNNINSTSEIEKPLQQKTIPPVPVKSVIVPTLIPKSSSKEKSLASINSKWLSIEALNEIQEFMGEEVHQLLEMFEQETPNILTSIREALKNKNHDEVKKKAHMLKSTSANIGANGLSFFARKMEIAANNRDAISALVTIYTKLTKAYIITKKEIKKYLMVIK